MVVVAVLDLDVDARLRHAARDLADRQASQDAFYGSPDWRQGPRDEILSLIDTHASIVIEMDDTTLNALRKIR